MDWLRQNSLLYQWWQGNANLTDFGRDPETVYWERQAATANAAPSPSPSAPPMLPGVANVPVPPQQRSGAGSIWPMLAIVGVGAAIYFATKRR